MNVKMIRELVFDCYTGKHHEFDEILFAEMIVKEFITICKSTVNDEQDYEDMDEYEKGWADSADRIIELSIKHFGVEE